mmetsp:Transcript_6031/g.13191  ORF Transcript_6031/g.13191 Transcript_6031/m.13191 type:complete len:351 (+) Transcript_6031:274-1326(+)
MEQALTNFTVGLDRLPFAQGYGQIILRIVASRRSDDRDIRGCETILLGNNSAEYTLSELIERVCGDADAVNKGGIVRILQLEGFRDMEYLPENLDRLFPSVVNIHIVNCPLFSSLSTAVARRHLTHLCCRDCPSLTSLASLSSLPIDSQLQTLSFHGCGLAVTKDDDWGAGMEALARTRRNDRGYLSISITGCEALTHIPSSIGKLKDTIKESISIYLKQNINLAHLPYEIGNITNLKIIGLDNCPKISHLPWTLSRLDAGVSIDLSNMWGLLSNMRLTKAAKAFGPPFFTIEPTARYFVYARKKFYHGLFWLVVYFGRARKRAIERLYAPGGTRYEESRERFEEAIRVW